MSAKIVMFRGPIYTVFINERAVKEFRFLSLAQMWCWDNIGVMPEVEK